MFKFFLIALFISITITQGLAQPLPEFLPGTWKAENSETYEHWDKLNNNSYKGFGYELKDRKMFVTEYLEIKRIGNQVVFIATVLNQNQGIGVEFKLNFSNDIFSFENPSHDFPKFIRYQQVSENKMKAIVGTNENNFILYFDKLK